MEDKIGGVPASLIDEFAKDTEVNCPEDGYREWCSDKLIETRKELENLKDKIDLLLKMQIEECQYYSQRVARDSGAVNEDYHKWIGETPILKYHRK